MRETPQLVDPNPLRECYEPRFPNSYAELKRMKREKEQRDLAERQRQDKAKLMVDEERRMLEQRAALLAPALFNQPSLDVSRIDADELHRRRVAMSSKLGIKAAEDLEKQQHEFNVKQRQEVKKQRTMSMLANFGVEEGKAMGDSSLVGPLEMRRTSQGSVIIAPSTPTVDSKKPPLKGKAAATILVRNFKPTIDESLSLDIQTECAKYGLVKSVRILDLGSTGIDRGFSEFECVRVLVRFDNVLNAVRAAEALHWRLFDGRRLCVAYFPTALFDKGTYEPHPDEEKLSPEMLNAV